MMNSLQPKIAIVETTNNNADPEFEVTNPYPVKDGQILRLDMTGRSWHEAHGLLGSAGWPTPRMTKYCSSEARPGYSTTLAHEYEDDPDVLDQKVGVLANLITQSRRCLLYTGAGLSTSAGIDDYATRSSAGEIVRSNVLKSPLLALPTFAHYALACLCHR